MLYCIIFFLASLFILLCLPVYFVISYNGSGGAYFRFLFIKKRIPIEIKAHGGFLSTLNELSSGKDKVLDIYEKLNGKVKISSLVLDACVGMQSAALFPYVYAIIASSFGAFVAALDERIGVNKNRAQISINCVNSDTYATVFGKITLRSSLFNFLFASTYALFRAIFKGGKNGRKQAK